MATLKRIYMILLTSCICSISSSVIIKSATLTPSEPSSNGASIEILKDVTQTNDEWLLSSSDSIGFQLQLTLNPTWSFASNQSSSIILEIDSNTPISTQKSNKLLLTFIQSNSSYLTNLISIDNLSDHQIYPPCNPDLSYSLSFASNNILELISNNSSKSRFNKSTNNESYSSLLPSIDSTNIAYPLIFSITNEPYSHTLFAYTNPGVATRSCGYTPISDDPLEIYFALNEKGQQFNITSINITLIYANEIEKDARSEVLWYMRLDIEILLGIGGGLIVIIIIIIIIYKWRKNKQRRERDRSLAHDLQMANKGAVQVRIQQINTTDLGFSETDDGPTPITPDININIHQGQYTNNLDDDYQKKMQNMEKLESESEDQFEDDMDGNEPEDIQQTQHRHIDDEEIP